MIRFTIKENTPSIAEKEGINPKIFSEERIFKDEECEKIIKKIREEYFQFLNVFLSGISMNKLENELGISKESQKKEFENTILCFKGAFKSFLENIKEKYSKDKNLWGKNKFQQKKKGALGKNLIFNFKQTRGTFILY